MYWVVFSKIEWINDGLNVLEWEYALFLLATTIKYSIFNRSINKDEGKKRGKNKKSNREVQKWEWGKDLKPEKSNINKREEEGNEKKN